MKAFGLKILHTGPCQVSYLPPCVSGVLPLSPGRPQVGDLTVKRRGLARPAPRWTSAHHEGPARRGSGAGDSQPCPPKFPTSGHLFLGKLRGAGQIPWESGFLSATGKRASWTPSRPQSPGSALARGDLGSTHASSRCEAPATTPRSHKGLSAPCATSPAARPSWASTRVSVTPCPSGNHAPPSPQNPPGTGIPQLSPGRMGRDEGGARPRATG